MELPLDGRTRAGLRRIILKGIGIRLREGQITSIVQVEMEVAKGWSWTTPPRWDRGGMPGGRNPATRDAEAIYGAKEINAVEDDSHC